MSKGAILVVDDDREMRVSLSHLLENAGYESSTAKSGKDALSHLAKTAMDTVLCDVRMPEMTGLEFQEKASAVTDTPVILLSAHGDIPMAVEAIQSGAYSFLEKPFEPRRLLAIVGNAVRMKRLQDKASRLQDRLSHLTDLSQVLIGDSPQISNVRQLIFDYADTPANVIIMGKTGTGKELVARALHDLGLGTDAPFVAVNCAVIPPDRFEETVLGHETREGLLSSAEGGTLFLDELASMPLETQSKFLRSVELQSLKPGNPGESYQPRVRIVSAASEDLDQRIAKGQFREDLLFRLNTLVIEIPDLSERGEDVLLLFRHYLGRIASLYQIPAPELSSDDYAALLAHDWPGNVRELQSVVERRVLSAKHGGGSVRQAILGASTDRATPPTLREAVAAFERELIGQAIVEHDGRMDSAANALGIGRRTLNEKVAKLGIDKAALFQKHRT